MRPDQLRPKKAVVRWNEEEWDRLADLVHSMRRNSPDSIASLANRAQKQFPKDRQRPGILTTAALQPLVERIQQKDRDLQAKAQKSDEYATKLSFFEKAPATREELLTSLNDDEIRGNFMPRLLQMLAPVDVIAAFKTEVVLDSVTTDDLAAVLARRLVADWERPIQVSVQLPEQRIEQRSIPRPKINGHTNKILIIGAKGDQPRHLRERVGYIADLTFIETERLDRQSVPRSVDFVVLWSKFVSHQQREIVLSVVEPRKVSEHFGGLNANIKGVQLNADARVTDTTPQGLRPLAKSGASETPGGSYTVTSTGYKVFPVLAQYNPATGALWTPAEIAAMQIGIEHV